MKDLIDFSTKSPFELINFQTDIIQIINNQYIYTRVNPYNIQGVFFSNQVIPFFKTMVDETTKTYQDEEKILFRSGKTSIEIQKINKDVPINYPSIKETIKFPDNFFEGLEFCAEYVNKKTNDVLNYLCISSKYIIGTDSKRLGIFVFDEPLPINYNFFVPLSLVKNIINYKFNFLSLDPENILFIDDENNCLQIQSKVENYPYEKIITLYENRQKTKPIKFTVEEMKNISDNLKKINNDVFTLAFKKDFIVFTKKNSNAKITERLKNNHGFKDISLEISSVSWEKAPIDFEQFYFYDRFISFYKHPFFYIFVLKEE